ncbi:MAG: hypothetical protein AVDCRST_MAG64-3125, partial [uncultured Phycisphaerae bacterium]
DPPAPHRQPAAHHALHELGADRRERRDVRRAASEPAGRRLAPALPARPVAPRVRELRVPPRRRAPPRGQHAVPVHLREQRQRQDGPPRLPRVLPRGRGGRGHRVPPGLAVRPRRHRRQRRGRGGHGGLPHPVPAVERHGPLLLRPRRHDRDPLALVRSAVLRQGRLRRRPRRGGHRVRRPHRRHAVRLRHEPGPAGRPPAAPRPVRRVGAGQAVEPPPAVPRDGRQGLQPLRLHRRRRRGRRRRPA